jgi:hypothetical protein
MSFTSPEKKYFFIFMDNAAVDVELQHRGGGAGADGGGRRRFVFRSTFARG